MTKIETIYPNPTLKVVFTYNVRYDCGNCGWSGVRTFGKGVKAPATVLCPKCDCRTANKQVALPYAPRRLDEKEYPPTLPTPYLEPWKPLPRDRWTDPTPRFVPYCVG